ncbi:rhomboid family intramembrane serine protease [Candidatus Bathyarchaeota archaeon]|nr:MAG: rhomboid family intramembrane serine protease [Candidatus Bathyarchaeota archaeon]
MLPLKDVNRALTTPHVNRMLIMVNVLVFVVMCLSDFGLIDSGFTVDISDRFAMIPQDILDGERLYTLFTSVFLHAGFFHLFGNVLFLYIFGDNVEGAFGHVSYIGFYVVCGLVAGFVHILSITNSGLYMMPVVGASGAISGVLGAYLVLYPKAKVLTLIFPLILPLPAIIFLGFWFLMQWFYVIFEGGTMIAYWAHIGGFVSGMILALVFGLKRKRAQETRFHL